VPVRTKETFPTPCLAGSTAFVQTWARRELLLQDDYWLRNAYIELVRFQDTPAHPGEMRIGRDETRPTLHVRAFPLRHP